MFLSSFDLNNLMLNLTESELFKIQLNFHAAIMKTAQITKDSQYDVHLATKC